MKAKISALKEQYAKARTDREICEIDRQMKGLEATDPDVFASVMLELARETADRAEEVAGSYNN